MNATLAEYAARGWSLKPVLAGQKRPAIKGWPDREFGPADCGDGMNIAIRLGKHSRDLVDCDLDCEEAIELAPLYLPETWAIFGRSSAPRSHRLHFAPEAQFEAFVDPIAKETLLELRAEGRDGGAHITIVPPSVADGERREWCGDTIDPAAVDSLRLRQCFKAIAAYVAVNGSPAELTPLYRDIRARLDRVDPGWRADPNGQRYVEDEHLNEIAGWVRMQHGDRPSRQPEDDSVVEKLNAQYAVVNEAGKVWVFEEWEDPQLRRNVIVRFSFADFQRLYMNRSVITPEGAVGLGRHWLTAIAPGSTRNHQTAIHQQRLRREAMNTLEKAVELAQAGIPVFPVNPDKSPACAHGFRAATGEVDQVRRLFLRAPQADRIGMPTGRATGIAVIDVDPAGQEWLYAQEAKNRWPATRIHSTPRGGRHLFFLHPAGLRSSSSKLAPGVDIRAEGGCITIWGPGYDVVDGAAVAPFPRSILHQLARLDRAAEKRREKLIRSLGGEAGGQERLLDWLRTAPRGERNQRLFWASCRAGAAGRDGSALIAAGNTARAAAD